MKKFIRGTFELDQNVVDLIGYEEKHMDAIKEIIDWANKYDVEIKMGTSEDDSYLIEYKIIGSTRAFCKGLLSELKLLLKKEWKKAESLMEASGDILW